MSKTIERYMVIEIGCLECSDGDPEEVVVGYFADLEDAIERRDVTKGYRSAGRFIVDLGAGVLV